MAIDNILLNKINKSQLEKFKFPDDTIFDENYKIKEEIFDRYDTVLDRDEPWCKGKQTELFGVLLK